MLSNRCAARQGRRMLGIMRGDRERPVLPGPTPCPAVHIRLPLGAHVASCYTAALMPTAILRRSVAQLFMVGLPGPTLDRATGAFLAEHPPGGVVLFKRNIRSPSQLRRLTEAIHATGAGVRPLVA